MVQLVTAQLLPNIPVDARTRKLARFAALASLLVFVVLTPLAQVKLVRVPAFIPIYESALLLNDLITAVMLFGHFSILRTRSLLVLASGYLFTAFITVPHALTFPDLFAPSGLLGAGSQSTAWLYVAWHAGFPLFLVAYAVLARQEQQQARPVQQPGRAMALSLLAVLALAVACTLLVTVGHDWLPPILQDGRYTWQGRVSLSATWACSALALAVLWRYSGRTTIDIWLGVVMVAWLCDVGLSAVLNAGRFDLGFYSGRIFGLLAASYVLIVLLLESNKLFAKLALAHEQVLHSATEMQAIVNNIGDCVLTTDEQGIIRSANPALSGIFGYAPPAVLGRPLAQLVPGLRPADGGVGGEWEGVHQDGRQIPLELSMTHFMLHGARLYLVVLRDIGERKKFVADLRQARNAAEQASRAKSVFLSNMSHELRTPLNAIIGFSQILGSDTLPVPDNKRKEFNGHILKAGRHLLALINEVLDLAKVESGLMSLSQEPVELAEVLESCREMIAPLARERGIGLAFDVARGLHVRADRTRLKQVLINLLSNAVKYNRPDGEVRVTAALSAPGIISLTVQDQGQGLDASQLAQLFQPFNRLGREAGEEEGTGIGLVLTRRLVEMMGGSISVTSTVGAGSSFRVDLHAAVAPSVADDADSLPLQIGAPAGAARRKLLYVEDNPANLALVREITAFRPDLQLLSAGDAASGMALARSHKPDVIVMDINLPGMSGNQAMRLLRADPELAAIPVIALSANAMPSDIERSMQEGFVRYLTKPLNVAEFLQAVDAATARSPA